MSRWVRVFLIILPAVAACAPKQPREAGAALPVSQGYANAPVLKVRSDFYHPVAISLIGDGVTRLGVVERHQVRYFHLPDQVTAPERYVAIEARPVPRTAVGPIDGLASFTSKLLSLHPGDALELRLEHTLTLSTLLVRPKQGADETAGAELRRQ